MNEAIKRDFEQLKASEQAWKETEERLQRANQHQSDLYRKLELRHRDKCEQLKQAAEVLNHCIGVIENTLDAYTCPHEDLTDAVFKIQDFLSSLSQEGVKPE